MEHSAPTRRRVLLLALLALLLAGWAWQTGRLVIPEAWQPWAPLRIDAPLNGLTRHKLIRDSADREACQAALAQAPMRLVPLEDHETGVGCGFDNAVTIERTSVAVGPPFSLSCRAALSLAMWERHTLQQAARRHLGSKVVAIEHFGSYACRNLYGKTGRRRSQHATADALDIAGFILADGRRIRVLGDWSPTQTSEVDTTGRMTAPREGIAGSEPMAPVSAGSSPEAAFLRDLHSGACDWFDVVLGPDYNRAHADHFHFDRGRAALCR
jgi:hypothetical protein